MLIFDFLRKEPSQPWTGVLVMTVISGIANGALLALINTGASAAASDSLSIRLLLLFLCAMAIFITAKKFSLDRTMTVVERMVKNLRLRICDKIRQSELTFIEGVGKGQLYTTLSQDANLISQSAFIITNASQEAIMLCFALVYVAYLSFVAFFIIVGFVAAAVLFYQQHRRSLMEDLGILSTTEGEFLDSMDHILDGFKEARLNYRKNQALFRAFEAIADRTEELKVKMGDGFVIDIMFSHVFFYTLIGIIVFLLPRIFPAFQGIVLQMTAAVLFIIAPLEMIVSAMPMFARSNAALGRLYNLEEQLDEHLTAGINGNAHEVSRLRDFETIELHSAAFTYRDAKDGSSFTVGPIDLEIKRGEVLFIVGGNGSGKSTLLKMLTGLYPIKHGTLTVDRLEITPGDLPSYRALISAVFADFHLFDRLYGMEEIDEKTVQQWIDEMQLGKKTGFKDGRFTNLNLSTGQRKRLALIVALLEDREIYVFDEWAADQDVEFRERFYNEILPNLKKAGKTVIAVTHDDRYWGVADRRVKLDMGRIVDMEREQAR